MNASSSSKYESSRYRYYVLGILTIVYAVNFIDRQLLVILQESIKAELLLSDKQLGLLSGFTFAVFYVLAGIPIARLADSGNRRNIVAVSLSIWSLMTAVSGFVGNYIQLLLARIGVGVGEAGCSPPAHSMVSDIFPPEKRAAAMSFYSIGINVGIMFGFLLGGYLSDVFGWRTAFVVVGLPGVALAVLMRLSVAEPQRGFSEHRQVKDAAAPFLVTVRAVFSQRFLVHMSLGAGVSALAGYGFVNWSASYYIRTYQVSASEAGTVLAMGVGVLGAVGTFFWGYMSDRFATKHAKWYAILPGIAMLMAIPPIIIMLMAQSKTLAIAAGMLPAMFSTAYMGAALATFHGSVEPRMRATASAIFFLILNIIGLGLGPTLVGVFSDFYQTIPAWEASSLRYALLTVVPTAFAWASLHFFLAARTMSATLSPSAKS